MARIDGKKKARVYCPGLVLMNHLILSINHKHSGHNYHIRDIALDVLLCDMEHCRLHYDTNVEFFFEFSITMRNLGTLFFSCQLNKVCMQLIGIT
jgi:hypothetical protein